MNTQNGNWNVPGDWLWHFGMLVMTACVALMAGILLPFIARLKTADVTTLYASGAVVGVLGVLLLFVARLPLYRARESWTLGLGQLDRKHRCYGGLGYLAVAVSLLLLGMAGVRTL